MPRNQAPLLAQVEATTPPVEDYRCRTRNNPGLGVMPKVVDSWSSPSATVRDSAAIQQLAKQPVDSLETPRPIPCRGEEVRVGWSPTDLGSVLLQTLHQRQCRRDQAILAELRSAHRQDAVTEVNVGNTQLQHLVDPQAAAIEQAKDLGHDEVAQRRCLRIRCRVDQPHQAVAESRRASECAARRWWWAWRRATGPAHRRGSQGGTGTSRTDEPPKFGTAGCSRTHEAAWRATAS